MNAFDHFRTEIDGTGIHFIHVRSPARPTRCRSCSPTAGRGRSSSSSTSSDRSRDPAAHGGDPADAFHVVVPSLPGYGFSGPTVERGWHPGRVAGRGPQLMAGLGYDRYVAQGGDWGCVRDARAVALADPEHCAGIHLNMRRRRSR